MPKAQQAEHGEEQARSWVWNVPDFLGARVAPGARMQLVLSRPPGVDAPLLGDLLRYLLHRQELACPSELSTRQLQASCPDGFGYADLLDRFGVRVEVRPAG